MQEIEFERKKKFHTAPGWGKSQHLHDYKHVALFYSIRWQKWGYMCFSIPGKIQIFGREFVLLRGNWFKKKCQNADSFRSSELMRNFCHASCWTGTGISVSIQIKENGFLLFQQQITVTTKRKLRRKKRKKNIIW